MESVRILPRQYNDASASFGLDWTVTHMFYRNYKLKINLAHKPALDPLNCATGSSVCDNLTYGPRLFSGRNSVPSEKEGYHRVLSILKLNQNSE